MTPQQIEALNIAGQCRATASSPLAKNILVDEGNGLLTELLLDAARIIEALAQPEQEPVATVTSETGADMTMSWWHEPALPIGTKLFTYAPQRKPLTDEQIYMNCPNWLSQEQCKTWVRQIEAAHGIKENT